MPELDAETLEIVREYIKYRFKAWRYKENLHWKKRIQEMRERYGSMFLEAVRKDYVKGLHRRMMDEYAKRIASSSDK